MKPLSTACLLLLLAKVASGQVSTPTPAGMLEIQPVDNYVLVFHQSPFRLVCKTPADIYFWRGSKEVEVLPQGPGAEITASNGEHWVRVVGMTIDWENRKFETSEGLIKFVVGQTPDPDDDDDDDDDPDTTQKVSQITYVFAKERADPPSEITQVLTELGKQEGVHVGQIDHEARTGSGNFPSQYLVARDAAKNAGLPALVFQASDKVLLTMQNPKTQDAVLREFERLNKEASQ